jgi:hypothetical protein
MQYIIWLAPLAVIAISKVNEKFLRPLVFSFVVWQGAEILFQFSFFQNILTDLNRADAPTVIDISGFAYGVISSFRYTCAVAFTLMVIWALNQTKIYESQKMLDDQGERPLTFTGWLNGF